MKVKEIGKLKKNPKLKEKNFKNRKLENKNGKL